MDYDVLFRFLSALIFVLGLIGLLAWAARRFGLAGRVAVRPGRRRRTLVVEATALDAKRRLVLVRRDDVEHLILLGPASDLVVEQCIAVPAAELAEASGSGQSGGKPRDFSTELKARLGFAQPAEKPAPTASAPSASTPPPLPPSPPAKAPLPASKRRLSKTKLAQLKPERFRLGKQPPPGTKR